MTIFFHFLFFFIHKTENRDLLILFLVFKMKVLEAEKIKYTVNF